MHRMVVLDEETLDALIEIEAKVVRDHAQVGQRQVGGARAEGHHVVPDPQVRRPPAPVLDGLAHETVRLVGHRPGEISLVQRRQAHDHVVGVARIERRVERVLVGQRVDQALPDGTLADHLGQTVDEQHETAGMALLLGIDGAAGPAGTGAGPVVLRDVEDPRGPFTPSLGLRASLVDVPSSSSPPRRRRARDGSGTAARGGRRASPCVPRSTRAGSRRTRRAARTGRTCAPSTAARSPRSLRRKSGRNEKWPLARLRAWNTGGPATPWISR